MITRLARVDDVPQLIQLGKQLWDLHLEFDPEYYLLENTFTETFSSWVYEQLNSPYQFIIVAHDENNLEIIGFIAGFLKYLFPWFKTKTVGHISYLIIDPPYRNQSIGKQLEKAAQEWFRTKKVNYIELYVDEKNNIGQAVWSSYGYLPFKKFLRKTI